MTYLVPAQGPLDAPIAIIGEAPGFDEARLGVPFVGASGEALNDYLQPYGFTERFLDEHGLQARRRTNVYVTNVIKERPARNDIELFVSRTKRGIVKTTPEYDRYEAGLLDELARTSARVIVPLGNVALWATTRRWGIEQWRGSILEGAGALAGRKIVPTYHPAFALRESLAAYVIRMDLARIMAQAAFPEIRRHPRTLRTAATLDEALAYISVCRGASHVGFDIETKPCGGSKRDGPDTWEMSCFALALSPTDAMCVPILGPSGLIWTPFEHACLLLALSTLLDDARVIKVGQNLNFDASFLLHKHSVHINALYDTMIAQRLVLCDDKQRKNPILALGLDFLTSIYTEEPYYKDEGKQWFDTHDWKMFYDYNAKDAAVCLEIRAAQLPHLERLRNTATYERHIRTLPALLYMQERGVRSDTRALDALKIVVRAELDEGLSTLLARVRDTVAHRSGARDVKTGEPVYIDARGKQTRFNESFPNSPAQCKAYFYGVLRQAPYKARGGSITTDDEALVRLSRKGIEEASLVLAYRKKSKLMSAYLQSKLDGGRFFCQYKPVGTVTGRLASAANIFGAGLNLQTLPRKGPFKSVFLPDDGYLLVSHDYAQAENRIMAYSGGVTALIRAFETGIDAYAVSAVRIAERLGFSLTYEQLLDAHRRGESAPIAGGKTTWRGLGKVCNLALSYNMGIDRFSRENELPLRDAGLLHAAWHAAFPEVRAGYHAMIQEQLSRDRTVVNPFGRHRRFLGRHSRIEGRSEILEPAYSHFCQSTVADAINEYALCRIVEEPTLFGPLELLLQIHDSIVYQLPLALGDAAITAIVNSVKAGMETLIEWRGVSFRLPAATSVSVVSLGDMIELGEAPVTAERIARLRSETTR